MPADSLASFLDHARKLPNLTRLEERELCQRARAGDEAARHKLVEHNIRLAVKYAREWQGCGLTLEDLIQEACLGLSVAAGKFDPDKGRFTTYATQWIRKYLYEAGYGKADTIKRPSQLARVIVQIQEHISKNPYATIDELTEKIRGLGIKGLEKVTADDVREAMDHGRVVASINEETFREVSAREVADVASALEILSHEEREAVSWRYGMYGSECSLEIVAEHMTADPTIEGSYTLQDAGKLCRAAVRKLRAARYDDDDEVICVIEEGR